MSFTSGNQLNYAESEREADSTFDETANIHNVTSSGPCAALGSQPDGVVGVCGWECS